MLDIKLMLSNKSFFEKKIQSRINNFSFNNIIILYDQYRSLKYEIEFLQFKRKFFTKKIYLYIKTKKKIDKIITYVKLIRYNIIFKKKILKQICVKLHHIVSYIPNIPEENIPFGFNDNCNKIVYSWGIKKNYSFTLMSHIEIGKYKNKLDFTSSGILSGSNFVVMRDDIASLYRAITQFMLDTHIRKSNYCEIYVPYIVKSNVLYGTGQLPKFDEDIYYLKEKEGLSNLSLIPTSEVCLVNLFTNKILKESDFPIKLVANTPCFRYESGSYGKKNKGLFRLHQFDKVELVQIVHPENSFFALEQLTNDAEGILKMLNLPYRKILLCTNKMSFSACKTYDIEVWSPVTETYLEVSSCSNTSDFQSRRINARYYDLKKNKNILVHAINGSGLAVGRTLIAILENYQVSKGVIKIPDVLINYMNGLHYIKCFV